MAIGVTCIAVLIALAVLIASHNGGYDGTRPRPPTAKIIKVVAPLATPPAVDVPLGSLSAPLPEAGVSLAEDPTNPHHLVAAMNDYNAAHGMTVTVSDDGGRFWQLAPLPRIPRQYLGDPQLAYGPHGVLYLAGTGYDRARGASAQAVHLAINLFRSRDGGRHWVWMGQPSGPPSASPGGDDFPALAVDRRDGTIILAWTRLMKEHESIAVTESSDGGKTFSPRHYLPTQLGEGAAALTDRYGTAYVAYMDLEHGSISLSFLDSAAWQTVHAAPLREIPSPLPGLDFRVHSYPYLATDTRSGRHYLAWAAWLHDHAQILLSASVDGGEHWSTPSAIAVNPAYDSFMPAIAVSPTGVLVVAFLRRTGPAGMAYHTYLATSLDCGRYFAPPRQVDRTVSRLGPRSPSYLGDYIALAVDGTSAHVAWTDTRGRAPVVFTRALPLPAAANGC